MRKKNYPVYLAVVIALLFNVPTLTAQEIFRDTGHTLLRSGTAIEWDEFEGLPAQKEKVIRFSIPYAGDYSISLIQYDVKQNWRLVLNNQEIGVLPVDGNAMRVYFDLPAMFLQTGENVLKINQAQKVADDIMISDLSIVPGKKKALLSGGSVVLSCVEKGRAIPARFTVVDQQHILQSTGTILSERLVIRPGMIYSADGKVEMLLPEGNFKIYATRGFEYGVDSITVSVKRGDRKKHQFRLSREVDTEGWISMDPHIHTLTYSGHGDVSATERAVTIAGEGIEVAVVTEHNQIVDYSDVAAKLNLGHYYTVIPGDEVTTAIGHFNFFPLDSTVKVPDYRAKQWLELKESFAEYHSPVIILNHGRDIHNGFRPFSFLETLEEGSQSSWPIPANAMEIVNSGALLSDPMLLINDWFNLLQKGIAVTPIGASDSHDAGRYLVGQARTYVQTGDQSPGKIDQQQLLQQIKKGKVSVSFGLMANINLSATDTNKIKVIGTVIGPAWINADTVLLYANGKKIKEEIITNRKKAGIKWNGSWELERPAEKTFYVIIARGAHHATPFWPIVKPFQPISSSWKPYVLGVSRAAFY